MTNYQKIYTTDGTFSFITDFDNSIKEKSFHALGRLRTCNANVFENDEFIFLVSYQTCVAIYDKYTDEVFDILRTMYGYTATSAQHISKFIHDYAPYAKVFRTDRDSKGSYYKRVR